MTLPRLTLGKILELIYVAIKDRSVVHFKWDGKLIGFDGKSKILYSSVEPEFMLRELFYVTKVGTLTYKFSSTITYDQLIGEMSTNDPGISYLRAKYPQVNLRVRNFVDLVVNK